MIAKTKIEQLIAGLSVFAARGESEVAAEHDVIYAGSYPAEKLLPAELAILKANGWSWSDKGKSWHIFV